MGVVLVAGGLPSLLSESLSSSCCLESGASTPRASAHSSHLAWLPGIAKSRQSFPPLPRPVTLMGRQLLTEFVFSLVFHRCLLTVVSWFLQIFENSQDFILSSVKLLGFK